jgi:hypothetical protein
LIAGTLIVTAASGGVVSGSMSTKKCRRNCSSVGVAALALSTSSERTSVSAASI